MQLTYDGYITMRATIRKTCRPSQVEGMLHELAARWPEHHFEMVRCKNLMRDTQSVREVCHV